MDQEHEKYENVMKMLRRSRPDPGDPEQLSEKVISQIQKQRRSASLTEVISEFIFGWVYIGWMRRSMVTAAICLMLLFGYQQAILMRKVDALSSMSFVEGNVQQAGDFTGLEARTKIYTLFGRKTFERQMEMAKQKELDKFIESVNDLREQYKDVFRMIESDPQAKKYIDEHLRKTGQ